MRFDSLSQGLGEIDASPDVGFELGEAQADFLQSLGFAL